MFSWKAISKAFLVGFILAGSAYFIAKLNLFGLESASDRVADGAFQRVTAGAYGREHGRGQKAISVVYLNEQSLETMKGFGWNRFPPSYDLQWMMFEDLLLVGGGPPKAIYADFVYLGRGGVGMGGGDIEGFPAFRDGVAAATRASAWNRIPWCVADPIRKLACIVAAGGTPMIFGKPAPTDLQQFTEVQKALDAVSVLSPVMVRAGAYPVKVTYPELEDPAALGVHGFDIAPAVAMYAAWCLRTPGAHGCDPDYAKLLAAAKAAVAGRAAPAPPDVFTDFPAPLDVVWGNRPHARQSALTRATTGRDETCRGAREPGLVTRFFEQLAVVRGPGEGDLHECLYNLNIGYDRLVGGQGLEQSDLAYILKDRMLIVGGHFRASSDWVESPVHGQVPGVEYHAMALDNLIELGPRYRRNASAFVDSDLLKSLLIFALAVTGVLAVMWRNSLYDRLPQGERLRFRFYAPLYLTLFAVSAGAVLLITWLGVAFSNASPINWIGLTTVVVGFLLFATHDAITDDIRGSLERFPIPRKIMKGLRAFFDFLKFEDTRLLKPVPTARRAAGTGAAETETPDA